MTCVYDSFHSHLGSHMPSSETDVVFAIFVRVQKVRLQINVCDFLDGRMFVNGDWQWRFHWYYQQNNTVQPTAIHKTGTDYFNVDQMQH